MATKTDWDGTGRQPHSAPGAQPPPGSLTASLPLLQKGRLPCDPGQLPAPGI